jgi:Cu-Zn family superoxide dismutase
MIGRSLVIHESPDDLGMGGHQDSLTTGHAGDRITCAVIGYSKKKCLKISIQYTNIDLLTYLPIKI